MNKSNLPCGKTWSRPSVTRLGKIRDVAGGNGGTTQNNVKQALDRT